MENSHRFFQNRACPYFPCHKVADKGGFNCLFCYCPLYTLGDQCGGSCSYTAGGIKDCSGCLLPHSPGGYDYINSKFAELSALASQNRKNSP